MRKIPLSLIAFILIHTSLNAQFKKGTRMVSASIGTLFFNGSTSDITVANIGSTTATNKNFGLQINPFMGWFVSESTAAGVTLVINPQFDKTSYETNQVTFQEDEINTFSIGAGGFVRNYFGKGLLLPFGQAGINAGFSNLKTEGFFYGGSGASAFKNTYEGNSNGGFFLNASFTAGITKLISDHTGLDFYIGYNFSYNKNVFKRTTLTDLGLDGSVDETRTNETTTKLTNHGLMIGVGFQVFLPGKNR